MRKAHLKLVLPGAFLWLSFLLMVTGGFAVAEEPKGAGDKTAKASPLLAKTFNCRPGVRIVTKSLLVRLNRLNNRLLPIW